MSPTSGEVFAPPEPFATAAPPAGPAAGTPWPTSEVPWSATETGPPQGPWSPSEVPWTTGATPPTERPWRTSEVPWSTEAGPPAGKPWPTSEVPWTTEAAPPADKPWLTSDVPWSTEGGPQTENPWPTSEVPWSTEGGPQTEKPWSSAEVPWTTEGAPPAERPWPTSEGAEGATAGGRPWSSSEVPWSTESAWAPEDEVLGADERQLVSNTLAVPYRWVCAVDVTQADGQLFRGSGVLIGPRHVLTAAHVIYAEGAAPRAVSVAPARNGRTATSGVVEPVGRTKAVAWSVPPEYLAAKRAGSRYDFGLLTLERDVSALTMPGDGPLGHWGHPTLAAGTVLRSLEPAFLGGKPVHVCGYPGDWCGRTHLDPRVGCKARDLGTAQLVHHGLATFPAPMPGLLLHTADTYGGQSGAPVWMEFTDGSRYLVGVHVDKHVITDATTGRPLPVTANKAVHLSADVLALVRSWIA